MNVKTIVEQYLTEHGYDGLYLPAEKPHCTCQCELGNFMDCEEPDEQCTAGYNILCRDGSHGCIGEKNE